MPQPDKWPIADAHVQQLIDELNEREPAGLRRILIGALLTRWHGDYGKAAHYADKALAWRADENERRRWTDVAA